MYLLLPNKWELLFLQISQTLALALILFLVV